MRSWPRAAAAVVLTACAASQDAPWLREVARITVPTERVVAAAVSANGCVLATVAADGLVRVGTTGTWREHSTFVVPVRDAVRARIEGNDTLLVATADGELAFRLADGARVRGEWPPASALLPAVPAPWPCHRDGRIVSGNRPRGPLVIASGGTLLLWNVGSVRGLSSSLRSAWLTADGAHVLCARSVDLLVQPVGGGAPWSVPGLGCDALAVSCGAGSEFVAVDRHRLVVADAATHAVRVTLDLGQLGVAPDPPALVAIDAGGSRSMLGQHRTDGSVTGWWLDLGAPRAKRLHAAPRLAAWVDGEALVFDDCSNCCVADPGRWVRLAADASRSRAWAIASDSAGSGQPAAAIVPGGGEVVVAHWNETTPGVTLSRRDARDGTVRASATVGDDDWFGGLSIVGDHVLVHSHSDHTLELRRLDTLQPVVGKTMLPRRAEGVRVCAAERASRIAVQSGDDIVVFDVLPERTAK